jgi:hypothetical protein
MKMKLERRFLFDHYQQENFLKFYNLRQSRLTIEEYTMKSELLMLKCDID